MTPENLEPNYARLFHEATAKEGDVWHESMDLNADDKWVCSCGKTFRLGNESGFLDHIAESNPTYDNPRDILNRMKEFCGQSKYNKFLWRLGVDCVGRTQLEAINNFIENYCFNPPYLLKKAVEFLKGEG